MVYSDEQKQQVADLLAAGITPIEIAKKTAVKIGTIFSIRSKKLPHNIKSHSNAQDPIIRRLIDEEIARLTQKYNTDIAELRARLL